LCKKLPCRNGAGAHLIFKLLSVWEIKRAVRSKKKVYIFKDGGLCEKK
jgi:hypothetical protein